MVPEQERERRKTQEIDGHEKTRREAPAGSLAA